MTPKGKKIIKRIIITLTSLVVLAGIAISVVLHTILTPEKVTPIVMKLANEYLDAEVDCQSVEVTFFSSFPNLGILLRNGTIINPLPSLTDTISPARLPQDTLISFQQCLISFNPVAFLSKKKIIVNKLELNNPIIYAYVNPEGKANWEIISTNTENTDTIGKDTAFQTPEMNIKGVLIKDAMIIYDNRQQDIFTAIDSLEFRINGNMQADSADLNLRLKTKGLTAIYEGQSLTKQLPLKINSRLRNNRIDRRLTVEKALVNIGILELDATGALQKDSISQQTKVNIDFKLHASSLADLLEAIPTQVTDIGSKLIAKGSIDTQGRLSGYLGNDNYPVLTSSLQLKEGSLQSKEHPDKSGLKKIDIKGDARIDFSMKTPSYVNIEKILLQSASSAIECSGNLDDIFTKPLLQAKVDGNIDFNRMSQDLPIPKEIKTGGLIRVSLTGKCLLDDMLAANYGKMDITGDININNIVFKHPKEGIDIFAPSVKVVLGSNVKDSIRGREVESLLRGNLDADSILINRNNELSAQTGKLSARFRTSAPKDTNEIAVLATMIRIDNLRLKMGDSIQVRAINPGIMLRLAPSADNPSKPELSVRSTLDSLRLRMPGITSRINEGKLNMKIRQQEERTTRRFERRTTTDSVAWARRRDSIRSRNPESYLSFRLESNETRDLLRKWDISGSFECKTMRLRTPLFPLPVRMTQPTLNFTTNTLSITHTRLKAGSSDLILNGEIEGIRQALLRNGRIKAKLNMEADSIDFNQLIRTITLGSEYAGKDIAQKDSISKIVLDESLDLAAVPDTGEAGIFVIPKNIDFELDTRMKNAIYSNLALKNTSGKIIIRNQSIQLPDWHINSDVGNARLSLVYKAPDTRKAHVGMDLQMQRIYVGELIRAFPLIDTLAPMLRSFEGVVDCNMTALTELDSMSNIILKETTASCYLSGVNMVLLDGETFTEISKMLMFKNKKRNMIDTISVEMILEDSKIMVFPFQITMDRYVAAVGGTQNLDMSFDYHISVLKSPLPIKIGINLTGNPEKMKFRLAKPKYKDLFTPAKEQSLASVQINLRQQIQESLRKNINDIINESSALPSRRPQIVLNDSIHRELFELDTTSVSPIENEKLKIEDEAP